MLRMGGGHVKGGMLRRGVLICCLPYIALTTVKAMAGEMLIPSSHYHTIIQSYILSYFFFFHPPADGEK